MDPIRKLNASLLSNCHILDWIVVIRISVGIAIDDVMVMIMMMMMIIIIIADDSPE